MADIVPDPVDLSWSANIPIELDYHKVDYYETFYSLYNVKTGEIFTDVREFEYDEKEEAIDLAKSLHRQDHRHYVVFKEFTPSSEMNKVARELDYINEYFREAYKQLYLVEERIEEGLDMAREDMELWGPVRYEYNVGDHQDDVEDIKKKIVEAWDNMLDDYTYRSLPDHICPEDELPDNMREKVYDTGE